LQRPSPKATVKIEPALPAAELALSLPIKEVDESAAGRPTTPGTPASPSKPASPKPGLTQRTKGLLWPLVAARVWAHGRTVGAAAPTADEPPHGTFIIRPDKVRMDPDTVVVFTVEANWPSAGRVEEVWECKYVPAACCPPFAR
jgi:hypothetical protein